MSALELPERFILEVQDGKFGWMDHGLLEADKFALQEDGTLACTGRGGSPLFPRCIHQQGNVIDVLDGGGDQYTYRLVPFPGGGYTERT